MRRRPFGFIAMSLTLGLCACPRIEAARVVPEPARCQQVLCGGDVAVKTSLPVRTELTTAECKTVCASIWCGARPIGPEPGCVLDRSQTVSCSSTAYDCGHTFPRVCNASNCAGCCRGGDGTCDLSPSALVCGGESCLTCRQDAGTRDPRCSSAGCLALVGCGASLEGAPRLSVCIGDAGVPATFDPLRFCPATCEAADAGALLACASALGDRCADAGAAAPDLFVRECGAVVDAGADLACLDGCAGARRLCDERCPSSITSFDECMNCSARCGLNWVGCAKTCSR